MATVKVNIANYLGGEMRNFTDKELDMIIITSLNEVYNYFINHEFKDKFMSEYAPIIYYALENDMTNPIIVNYANLLRTRLDSKEMFNRREILYNVSVDILKIWSCKYREEFDAIVNVDIMLKVQNVLKALYELSYRYKNFSEISRYEVYHAQVARSSRFYGNIGFTFYKYVVNNHLGTYDAVLYFELAKDRISLLGLPNGTIRTDLAKARRHYRELSNKDEAYTTFIKKAYDLIDKMVFSNEDVINSEFNKEDSVLLNALCNCLIVAINKLEKVPKNLKKAQDNIKTFMSNLPEAENNYLESMLLGEVDINLCLDTIMNERNAKIHTSLFEPRVNPNLFTDMELWGVINGSLVAFCYKAKIKDGELLNKLQVLWNRSINNRHFNRKLNKFFIYSDLLDIYRILYYKEYIKDIGEFVGEITNSVYNLITAKWSIINDSFMGTTICHNIAYILRYLLKQDDTIYFKRWVIDDITNLMYKLETVYGIKNTDDTTYYNTEKINDFIIYLVDKDISWFLMVCETKNDIFRALHNLNTLLNALRECTYINHEAGKYINRNVTARISSLARKNKIKYNVKIKSNKYGVDMDIRSDEHLYPNEKQEVVFAFDIKAKEEYERKQYLRSLPIVDLNAPLLKKPTKVLKEKDEQKRKSEGRYYIKPRVQINWDASNRQNDSSPIGIGVSRREIDRIFNYTAYSKDPWIEDYNEVAEKDISIRGIKLS